MSEAITAKKIGIFNYVLTNKDGEELDSSQGHPMPYLHGYGNIIPGLEEHMEGKGIGDTFKVNIPPEKAYGPYDEAANFSVHRSELDKNILDDLKPGAQFFINNEQGQPVPIFVVSKEGVYVHFTRNHPLAGQTLTFDIEIVDIS